MSYSEDYEQHNSRLIDIKCSINLYQGEDVMSQKNLSDLPCGSFGATCMHQLVKQPEDSLLALIGLFAADQRSDKIDLGVGIYKDENGCTPVFGAIKSAESYLLENQDSKSYLGPEGDKGFFESLVGLVFSDDNGDRDLDSHVAGIQTPGGTGALRLGAELIAKGRSDAVVHLGEPTWPNHIPLFQSAGMPIKAYEHLDVETQVLCFDKVVAAIEAAAAGDVILLHGCCHNPTGADFSQEQWVQLAQLMKERSLLPFIDIAYQGLGDGLEQDAAGIRIVAKHCPEMLIAYSCDKNFGLYRERVGALISVSPTPGIAELVQSNLLSLARANWSMPPDHGAASVRVIMESAELSKQWRSELNNMRERISNMRAGLYRIDPTLDFIAQQKGMFSTLSLTPAQVQALREEHGVYMAGSGRINIAGLVPSNLSNFAAALADVQ